MHVSRQVQLADVNRFSDLLVFSLVTNLSLLQDKIQLEKVATIALPLEAARRDSISNLTSFGASNLSCRQTQCRFIHLQSVSLLSNLWTKVHEIFRQRKIPFAFSSALARLSISRFIQNIFAIKCRSRRKNRTKFLGPHFSWGTTPTALRFNNRFNIHWQSV